MNTGRKVQLRCPAGNFKSVEAALNNGADAVYVGFESPTNLRNFKGLNLPVDDAKKAVKLAHDMGKELFVVINSYPQKDEIESAFRAIDQAVELGVDAIIVSDMSNMQYLSETHPGTSLHLSVQTGSANSDTINFLSENFNVKCVVLPRVLTVPEIAEIVDNTNVDIEVFAMGSLCTAYPGRCNMSQYVTGESTNTKGVCTSPQFLDFKSNEDESVTVKLNGVALNKVEDKGSISSCVGHHGPDLVKTGSGDGWPNSFIVNKRHVCKGTFLNQNFDNSKFSMHDWVILNTLPILGELIAAGVKALKIEGRQRPSEYSAESAKIMREAVDLYYANPEKYAVREEWTAALAHMFPEMAASTGPYMGR